MGNRLGKDSCILSCWYNCTDYCHTTTQLKETEITNINKLYLCSYPYCNNLTCWNYKPVDLPENVKFIKFRNNIYCSNLCKNSHKKHNYYNSIDIVSGDDYVDL